MNYSTITVDVAERVATVSMNRVERRNALDETMMHELTDAFQTLGRNSQSRVIILTGSGSAFCAGMDLNHLEKYAGLGQNENLEDARTLMKLLHTIYALKKPVIAAVNGPALGGGCGLAACCDFVFAGRERAKLGVPEVRLGFLPAVILHFLIKRVGSGAARELALMGGILDAVSAERIGLATRVVEDDRLAGEARTFALELARTTSPSAVSLTKDLFVRYDEMTLKDALDYAVTLNALARKTDDFRRGIDAFLKREKLEW